MAGRGASKHSMEEVLQLIFEDQDDPVSPDDSAEHSREEENSVTLRDYLPPGEKGDLTIHVIQTRATVSYLTVTAHYIHDWEMKG